MDLIYPEHLKKGDTIGILCVSGKIDDYSKLNRAKEFIESKGYNVKISYLPEKQNGYLCADDETRASELNRFFADKTIKAIIAARGGYGSIRIIDKIDYKTIKDNPKFFGGYSDITALSLMIYKNTGLVTYNSPMAYSDLGNQISDYTEKSFFDVIENGLTELRLENSRVYKSGNASGVLWGGNLSTIQSLCGIDFIPVDDFIFITEDINEPVYKIDKMFAQLFNISKFKTNCKAIVLGYFSNIDSNEILDKLFNEIANKYEIPVVKGLKFGHERDFLTFPIGVNAILNCSDSQTNIKFVKNH